MFRIITLTAAIALGATASQAEDSTPVIGESVLGVEVSVATVASKGYSAAKLIGATVHNDKAQSIGTVHDLIVGAQGDLSLAIVEVGGFLGLGSKWVAVPADLFEPGKADDVILKGASKDALMAMPPFRYAK